MNYLSICFQNFSNNNNHKLLFCIRCVVKSSVHSTLYIVVWIEFCNMVFDFNFRVQYSTVFVFCIFVIQEILSKFTIKESIQKQSANEKIKIKKINSF